MDKVCKGCEYLKVLYKPMMPYELGRAKCTKHNLITDFINMRKFGKLKCVETIADEQTCVDTEV